MWEDMCVVLGAVFAEGRPRGSQGGARAENLEEMCNSLRRELRPRPTAPSEDAANECREAVRSLVILMLLPTIAKTSDVRRDELLEDWHELSDIQACRHGCQQPQHTGKAIGGKAICTAAIVKGGAVRVEWHAPPP